MTEAKAEQQVLSTYEMYRAHPRIEPLREAVKHRFGADSVLGYKELVEILFVLDHLFVPLTRTIATNCQPVYMEFITKYYSDWSMMLEGMFYVRFNSKEASLKFEQKLVLSETLSIIVSQRIAKQTTVCNIIDCVCQTTSLELKRTLAGFFKPK